MAADFTIASTVEYDFMAMALEDVSFLLDNDVLAPALLIRVVNDKYFHDGTSAVLLRAGQLQCNLPHEPGIVYEVPPPQSPWLLQKAVTPLQS